MSYQFTKFEVKEIKKSSERKYRSFFWLNPHLSLNFTVQKYKKSRKKKWRKVQVQAKKVTAPKPIPKLDLGFGRTLLLTVLLTIPINKLPCCGGTIWLSHRCSGGSVDTVPAQVMGGLCEQIWLLLLLRDCPKASAHLNVLGHFARNRGHFTVADHSGTGH